MELEKMYKIAIIVSEFNSEITEKMRESAVCACEKNSVEVSYLIAVPGAYDMTLPASELVKREDVEAVVCLGAIIKGQTKHDEVIANALANNLQKISIESKKPILFGVIGPGATWEQADSRASEYGERCVLGAIKLIETLKKIGGKNE